MAADKMNDVEHLEFLESASPEREPEHQGRRLSWGTAALVTGMIAMALVLGMQLARQNASQPQSGPAPDFHLKLFDGSDFWLSDYRGRVVLINFWASWCPPCREEAPELQALYADYQDEGFVIVGVNMLESSQEKAIDFIEDFGITYPNGEDKGQWIANLYHIQGPPESFLIDRDGSIRRFILGSLRYDALSATIEALLAG